MPVSPHSAALSFSLSTVFCWGTSDFLGGYAARRANAFFLTTIAHASGVLLMVALALLNHSAFPSRASSGWALAAGFSGGAALAIFYRALSIGKMGLTAPIAAVVGAAIPAAVTMMTEGLPARMQIAGFVLAGIGIWLISRSEDGSRPAGIGLAVLAALGFAGFFLCMKQAGEGSALWLAGLARLASLSLTTVIVLLVRNYTVTRPSAILGVFAGFLDVSGSALFLRAAQSGRLDSAVVISSLYPAITVLLARLLLQERITRWQAVGMVAALAAVPMIA
jgi:drug/metabolite transporter (DMT)-like permease